MSTGAISRRGPLSLGLATSTTKPSMEVTPRPWGTMGAAMLSLCSLASARPAAATAARTAIAARPRLRPQARTPAARAMASAAARASGQSTGSVFRPR